MNTLEISPKSPKTRWVAIDTNDSHTIISEGVKPELVIKKADKTGKKYSMMYVPDPNNKYIF